MEMLNQVMQTIQANEKQFSNNGHFIMLNTYMKCSLYYNTDIFTIQTICVLDAE